MNALMQVAAVVVTPAPAAPVGILREEAACFDKQGNSIDLRGIRLLLSNVRRIGDRYYTIAGERVTIGNRPHHRDNIIIYDAFFIVNASSRSSLLLFHADLAGRPYLYWIEKREGDLARNGLLEINGDRVSPGCVGTVWR